MTIETIGAEQPVYKIDGEFYTVNYREYESFIRNCQAFMDADPDSMLTMTQIIADRIIDAADGDITMDEIRPQLKFLREVGFLLKGIISPAPDQDQR